MTEPSVVDSALFRSLMSRWATGVSVVTSRHNGMDAGLTVNSLISVTLTPPTLLVSLGMDADTTPVVRSSRRFAVSILTSRQREVSERFARPGPSGSKFEGIPVARTPSGLPVIEGAAATFDCRVTKEVEFGDHLLFFGAVDSATTGAADSPLLYHRSQYATGPESNP